MISMRPRRLISMACFLLLHGAGSDSWYWHAVDAPLRSSGHHVVAVDLPVDDDRAGLDAYVDVATRAVRGYAGDVAVVAQSMAAFVAPVVATLVPVSLIVLVAPMIPSPGESMGDWWSSAGQGEEAARLAVEEGRDPDAAFDPFEIFLHDVPGDVAAASAAHVRPQSTTVFSDPWPLDAWPSTPTRCLIGRLDRLFPLRMQRRLAAERLGIVADEIDTGHLPALARPDEVAHYLLSCWLAEHPDPAHGP